MKGIAGTTLAIIGLALGIAAGFGVVALKRYLISEIVGAINDEARIACNCSITYDSFNISFSQLQGKATNVRLLEGGAPKLTFPEVTSRFAIDKIFTKLITLYDLKLSDGYADGVGPDSATFRFIDQLTAPLPPERAQQDRWRVQLDTLEITNSSLRESFGASELLGNGVALYVKRIDENFVLMPTITDMRYRSFTDASHSQGTELPLGRLSASIVIEENHTVINSLDLGDGTSSTHITASVDTTHNDQCSGSAATALNTQYIGLPNWLQGYFIGSPAMSGTLGSPRFTGTVSNRPATPLRVTLPHASPLELSSVTGRLDVDVRRGDPIVRISELQGVGGDSRLRSTETLQFDDTGLSAGFEAVLPHFSYGPFSLQGGKARISIRPSPAGTLTELEIGAENLEAQSISLGPARVNVKLSSTAVETVVDSTNPDQGSLHWEGTISLSGPEPVLEKGTLGLTRYRYPLSLPVRKSHLSPIELTSTLSLSGPLDLARMKGEGPTYISFPALSTEMDLTGKTVLKNGVLLVTAGGVATKTDSTLSLDLVKTLSGKLLLNIPQTDISRFLPDTNCGGLAGTLDYSFPLTQPLGGSGAISLKNLELGCAPYTIYLPKNLELPISRGSLRWRNVTLAGFNTALILNGEVGFDRGFDMTLAGDLHLNALLPLLPSIDNLQGKLQTNVSLKGPLNSPQLGGAAKLLKGQLGLESPDIGANDIYGTFALQGSTIAVKELSGSLNNGTFSIEGDLVPFNWSTSNLRASLREVTINPAENATLTFSGDLGLQPNDRKHQALTGTINIDFAEISKDLDINRIVVQAIAGYFLPSRIQPQVSSEVMDIDLDVSVAAPRNIFVLTPFFSAELNASIRAQGTTKQPSLTGTMNILSGWVGLKGNRFDITNGSVNFKPGSLTPTIELASEGMLRTSLGDSILIILEASGPIRNPRITLSSDRGLSQDELLLLLTSSRSLGGRTMSSRSGLQFRDDQRFFFSRDSFSSLGSFLRNLTRFDTLSFEPMYNPFTGSIEPAIIARKDLSNRLSLVGESLFSTVSSSRAGVVYNISPTLSVNAFSQTVSTQQNAIISTDLTYTILSEQSQFVTFNISGSREVGEEELLAAARIGQSSRIKNNPDSLATIQRDILNYLRDQGFLQAEVSLVCPHGGEYCEQVTISVQEGPPATIKDIVVQGQPIPTKLSDITPKVVSVGDRATAEIMRAIEERLVLGLRNEGYIAARVSLRYSSVNANNETTLTIDVETGEPISFVFMGNTVFSSSDFLDSIDLFSRRRPFGNNTIKLLVQNIEAMYHDKGYLFVQVNYSEDRTDPSRLSYNITIKEETSTRVVGLTLTGNQSLSLSRIKAVMKELGYENQLKLLAPDYAVPAQLDTLKDILTQVYQQEGFPQAVVSYQVGQREAVSALQIEYSISEGEPLRFSQVEMVGAPEGLQAPKAPTLPTSLPRINSYISQLMERLRDDGYLFPGVTTTPGEDPSTLEISLLPGTQTVIGNVSIDGLNRISREVAEGFIVIKSGEPYRNEAVQTTKRELLRSGLFSRVEIISSDGALDTAHEDIIIRVVERPLNTLEVGTGANSEFGVHLFGEAVDKSIFADGRSFSTRVDTYLDQARVNPSGSSSISQGFANIRYLDPSLAGSDYTLTEEVRFQRQQLSTQEFDQDRLLLASYLFRQFNSGATLSAGHSLAFDDLFNVTPDAIISDLDDGSVRLSFLSAVAKLDRRDDPLLPRSGHTFTLEPKLSLEAIGSQADFLSIRGNATKIVPLEGLSPRWSLGLGCSAGYSDAFGNTNEIPITQRFYLGGRTTIRGFRENSLGPRGENGAVIGGDTLLAGKSQIQYLLADSFRTHIFFDSGNVFLRERSFSLGDLRYSTGVGFQLLSPIGPIGFDVGHPLDEKSGEPAVRVHFSVGSAF